MLSLDRLRDDDRFGAWLVGIGLNACRAMLRRQGSDPARHDARRVAGAQIRTPSRRPRRRSSRPGCGRRSRRCRAGQREAVTLFYLAGLTQAEAAEHLGIPPGAVKTRLHKARASLRARLEPLRRERAMPVEMQVTDVRRAGERHILMLEGGGRELKIWVGAGRGARRRRPARGGRAAAPRARTT